MPNRWVWVFGEATALQWVVDQQTMAFAEHAAGRIRPIAASDTAVLYVTRGAHHNPTRDVARLAGTATVVDAPRRPDVPVGPVDRTFPWTCPIGIGLLHGPPVTNLIDQFALVRKPAVCGAYFRTSPIRVSETDWHTMVDAIDRWEPDA